MAYILSPRAEGHFLALLNETEEYSGLLRSVRLEDKLLAAFESIARNPGLGHLRDDLIREQIYFYYVEPYAILYLRDTSPLFIIAIYHGARDIPALLKEGL
jgi:plasmid stabilization system protein ParE